MKNIIILFFSVLLFNCKTDNMQNTFQKESFKEIKFKNHSFEKLFKKTLKNLEISMEGVNNIILEFYIDYDKNYDTIVSFKNCPPINVKNLQNVKEYDNKLIYIYYTKNMKRVVNEFVDIVNDPVKSVNLKPVSNEFECIDKEVFTLKNNHFILIK